MRFAFLGTVFIFAFGTVSASHVQPQREFHDQPSLIEAESIAPTPPSIFATGIVEGRSREVGLRFEMVGRLSSVVVNEGTRVQVGETLARIDPSVWEHGLEEARANLAAVEAAKQRLLNGAIQEARDTAAAQVQAAQIRVKRARRDHARAAGLPKNAISEQEVDDRASELELAEAALAITERQEDEINAAPRQDEVCIADARIALERARMRSAETMLDKTILRAPSDGLVLQVQAELGELVGPDGQEPIVTFVDASETYVRAYVEEMDAVRVECGMAASVSTDGNANVRYAGKVVNCAAPSMSAKKNFRNDAAELADVTVREVTILLDVDESTEPLVVGLPVDVFLSDATEDQADSSL